MANLLKQNIFKESTECVIVCSSTNIMSLVSSVGFGDTASLRIKSVLLVEHRFSGGGDAPTFPGASGNFYIRARGEVDELSVSNK